MKNNKGRLPFLCFVAVCLLIALLPACEDGYHASVRGIYLSTEQNENHDDYTDEPLGTYNYPPITDSVRLSEKNTFYVVCDIPSSIKTLSLKFTYDEDKIDLDTGWDIDDYEDFIVVSKNSITLKQIDIISFPFEITVTAKSGLTSEPITVTVQPGNIETKCTVIP